jgi:YHS domain-containing protein
MIMVEKKSDRQIVAEFDGDCAMALAHGKFHFGDDRYVLQHDGKTYYFASAEAKKKFEQNMDENIQRADQNWQRGMAMGELRHPET